MHAYCLTIVPPDREFAFPRLTLLSLIVCLYSHSYHDFDKATGILIWPWNLYFYHDFSFNIHLMSLILFVVEFHLISCASDTSIDSICYFFFLASTRTSHRAKGLQGLMHEHSFSHTLSQHRDRRSLFLAGLQFSHMKNLTRSPTKHKEYSSFPSSVRVSFLYILVRRRLTGPALSPPSGGVAKHSPRCAEQLPALACPLITLRPILRRG